MCKRGVRYEWRQSNGVFSLWCSDVTLLSLLSQLQRIMHFVWKLFISAMTQIHALRIGGVLISLQLFGNLRNDDCKSLWNANIIRPWENASEKWIFDLHLHWIYLFRSEKRFGKSVAWVAANKRIFNLTSGGIVRYAAWWGLASKKAIVLCAFLPFCRNWHWAQESPAMNKPW